MNLQQFEKWPEIKEIMKKVEIYRSMAILGALLQLVSERIDAIENVQPLFKGVLKKTLNLARTEIDKVLNRIISTEDEKAQIECLALTTKIEESIEEGLKDVYKL